MELEPAAVRLACLVDDVAVHIEFPAVIQTAESALFVAAEDERSTAVQAMLAEHAEPSARVAEDDEVFAKHAYPNGCAVGLDNLFRHAGRQPMTAHDLAHRRVADDAGQKI